jgi:hypothetical protein
MHLIPPILEGTILMYAVREISAWQQGESKSGAELPFLSVIPVSVSVSGRNVARRPLASVALRIRASSREARSRRD